MKSMTQIDDDVRQDYLALALLWQSKDPTGELPFTFDADIATLFSLEDELQPDVAMTLFNIIQSMWDWHPTRRTFHQWEEVLYAYQLNRSVRQMDPIHNRLERGRREHTALYYVARAMLRVVFWIAVVMILAGVVWAVWAALRIFIGIMTGQL